MKTGIALAVAHWAAVAVWGFWGWAGFWAVVAAGMALAGIKNRNH